MISCFMCYGVVAAPKKNCTRFRVQFFSVVELFGEDGKPGLWAGVKEDVGVVPALQCQIQRILGTATGNQEHIPELRIRHVGT